MITPLPGAMRPSRVRTAALPGIAPAWSTRTARRCRRGGGYLVIKEPWPAMLRTLWGDDERYVKEVYWSKFEKQGWYFSGDGANKDEDGYYWIIGRSTTSSTSPAIASAPWRWSRRWCRTRWWPRRPWSAGPHEIKGQAHRRLRVRSGGHRARRGRPGGSCASTWPKIGAIAKPDQIHFTADLPKTRSGKIMRRLLRDIAEGRDTSATPPPWKTIPSWRACARSARRNRKKVKSGK
jgi:acetyl-CoA synthetase